MTPQPHPKPSRRGVRAALFALLLAASLAGCYSTGATMEAEESQRSDAYATTLDEGSFGVDFRGLAEVAPNARLETASEGVADAGAPQEPAPDPGPIERKRIRSGVLILAVADPEGAREAARETVLAAGGYVESEEDLLIRLRIPAEQWWPVFRSIRELGREVSRSIRTQDVTEQYYDVELRLANARELRDRLAELLAKAEKVEETLAIEKELARVRTEIESLEGRLRLLSQQIAYSTLDLHFRVAAETPAQGARLPFPWLNRLGVESLLGGRSR